MARCALECPAAWFTLRRDWDPATALMADPSPQQLAAGISAWREAGTAAVLAHLPPLDPRECGGLARVGVAPETVPLRWDDFVRQDVIDPHLAWAREAMDRESGSNPDEWRVSLEPVPASKWLAIEVRSGTREGERWEPLRL